MVYTVCKKKNHSSWSTGRCPPRQKCETPPMFDSVIYLAHNGTVTSLPVFILNIFNCVPKMKEALLGLEQRAGK